MEKNLLYTNVGDYNIDDDDPTLHKVIKLSGTKGILSSEESSDREDIESHYDKHLFHQEDDLSKNRSRSNDKSVSNDECEFDNWFNYKEDKPVH